MDLNDEIEYSGEGDDVTFCSQASAEASETIADLLAGGASLEEAFEVSEETYRDVMNRAGC